MRIKRKRVDLAEGDLTPMIDMTFQLIAFFMVLINFAQTEANDNVVLPNSQLVKPPDQEIQNQVILHVGEDGQIYSGGDAYSTDTLRVLLRREIAVITAEGKEAGDTNLIIRGHEDVATGKIQEIIQIAQEQDITNFLLRAKEDRRS